MYPRSINKKLGLKSLRGQQGFLMPVAIIIVVGLGALAIAMSRLGSQQGVSSIQEGLSLQAFYAAESGAQYAMTQLFLPGAAINRTAVDGRCDTLSDPPAFPATGLSLCSAQVSCSRSVDSSGNISYYNIESAASCQAGDLTTERSVTVTSFLE